MHASCKPKIALAGMMASGKTTLGRKLAEILGARFVDADEEMASSSGLTAREFFAERGEAAFRELERSTIARLLDGGEPVVLSLGGGAYLQPEIRTMLRGRARAVFLRVDAEELVRRLEGTDLASRPVLAAYADWREGVRAVLAKREAAYGEADIVFDAGRGEPAALARELADMLRTESIRVGILRKNHAYDILIGSFISDVRPGAWIEEIERRAPASQWILIADENVAAKHPVIAQAEAREKWRAFTLPAGEENKTLGGCAALLERLLSLGVDRKTVLVAMGGGVVGDLAGFAAATVLRGVRFVQVPTTLLAQADSSVGGKTGVNAAAGKNLVGAFHQPELVLIDAAFLGTLPEREYLSGMAEVAKYGLLGDKDFFARLTADAERLVGETPDRALLEGVIAHCCRMKRDVVAADETEKGRRGLLNLGHTFGHVLESLAGFDGTVTHGEAVAVGCAMAARFSLRRGLLSAEEHDAAVSGLRRLRLPATLSGTTGLGRGREDAGYWRGVLRPEAVRRLLLKDKKASSETLTLVLLHGIGDARLHGDVPADAAMEIMLESETS